MMGSARTAVARMLARSLPESGRRLAPYATRTTSGTAIRIATPIDRERLPRGRESRVVGADEPDTVTGATGPVPFNVLVTP
jgi:hypothetical protein